MTLNKELKKTHTPFNSMYVKAGMFWQAKSVMDSTSYCFGKIKQGNWKRKLKNSSIPLKSPESFLQR